MPTRTVPLQDLAAIIRSKNAGPYRITLDILFDDAETYRRVRDSKSVTEASVAGAYGIPEERISSLFAVDMANAIKVTLKRKAQGAFGESDMYGCQQHVPLMGLAITLEDK
ncbi:hypothetical protein FHS85_000731 [Rhodoligotrophos appendicifer]|uniref:DUF4387 domain-containing protein n=1 Tax=Rhodoligotrophos appendicifer TaxID=987056 RepID=UPI00117D2207|nr:DUF4387 domain-containing protein [Rhodoligotrophos appendicifer]